MCFGVPGVCSPGWFVGIFLEVCRFYVSGFWRFSHHLEGLWNAGGFAVFFAGTCVIFFIRGDWYSKDDAPWNEQQVGTLKMDGWKTILSFFEGKRPIFRRELLVSGRVVNVEWPFLFGWWSHIFVFFKKITMDSIHCVREIRLCSVPRLLIYTSTDSIFALKLLHRWYQI